MAICWGAVSIVKNVTIVDADVDPWDIEAVELAKSDAHAGRTRHSDCTRPAGGSLRATGGRRRGHQGGLRRHLQAGDRKEGYDKALPPAESYERMRALLARLEAGGCVAVIAGAASSLPLPARPAPVYGVRALEDAARYRQYRDPSDYLAGRASNRSRGRCGLDCDEIRALADMCYSHKDIGASIASGSFSCDGMLVAPCSIKTLSGIATLLQQRSDHLALPTFA